MNNLNLIEKLTQSFLKFPGVGRKTANRFIFHLIKMPAGELDKFLNDLKELTKIKICQQCFFPVFKNSNDIIENKDQFCEFCANSQRQANLICVIEKDSDLLAIENTGKYKGLYHILGGTILTFGQEEKSDLKTKELLSRLDTLKTKYNNIEVILALPPSTLGDATALYLEKLLKDKDIKTTRLARGLPMGADLEYADEITLGEALNKRS